MAKRVDTEELLKSKGYSYIKYSEPAVEPEYVDVLFKDIVEEFSEIDIGSQRLYKHQYEAYLELSKGHNIVLVAGTGSGKTEAWFIYLAKRLKNEPSTLAIAVYPTLALANDQVKRLLQYMSLVKRNLIQLDSVKKEELVKRHGSQLLRTMIASSNLIVTNPAFLLHDIKKYFVSKSSALLASVYHRVDLLVVDELDFYSPRSIALLLAMIQLLSMISEKKLQVAVLSAGISNPEDLCSYLENTTSRPCSTIAGKPFRVENRVYIVLGKNLHDVWMEIRRLWSDAQSKHPQITSLKDLVDDFEKFKSNAYYVISTIESLGYSVPSLGIDVSELISEYFNDPYVTLVFTRSIGTAEELVRSIKLKHGQEAPIASHHHLISKKLREEIEEKARRGEIKVIVSPRTLSQGVDIGLISRTVHLGLPDSVREFYQREGRKGRRRELEFSESVIIPFSRWDKELLSSGHDVLRSWLELGLEKTLVNPDNLYIYLFTGVIKLKSPWFKTGLNEKEKEALRRTGVLGPDNSLNEKALNAVFERINFYEYAPPYGIKRYIEKEDRLVPLEPIGHCDLVEKFQPGCIDYSEEALVISLELGKTSRYVSAVLEKDIRNVDFKQYDGLSLALEEYRYTKLRWGEKPQIVKDILGGKITSDVLCIVRVPENGFGKYVKVPERCIWTLKSEKPRILWSSSKPVVYYEKTNIYVPMPTGGEYRDFTYGYRYSVDPRENADLMRLALAYIVVILRRYYGLAFKTIMYDVTKIGEYKYFAIYEPEAAGIIDKLDWLRVRNWIESHRPCDLDRILISEIDDLAYSTLITVDFNWDVVKEQALRVVDYILLRDRVKTIVKGKELYIPRPSPALRIISYVAFSEVLGEDSAIPALVAGHGFYDGDTFNGAVKLYPPIPLIKPPKELLDLENVVLDKIYYEDYHLLVENREALIQQLKQANLRRLSSLLEKEKTLVLDLSELASRAGINTLSTENLASLVNVKPTVDYTSVREVLKRVNEDKRVSQKAEELMLKYMEDKAKLQYIAYLVINEILRLGNIQDYLS
ncbi:MAG: DEAD/DEAH box helicase [Desulfurococcaceae archaeon]